METATVWYLLVGVILTMVGLFHSHMKRLPLTTAMIYLPIGYALGVNGFELIELDPNEHASFIEHLSEIVVIISLFSAGLKLRSPLLSKKWIPAYRLAVLSMTITVVLVATLAVYGLGLPWGAGILLGAVLAPTDPVLAADVQVRGPTDQDPLRFSLTGEAGLNDGSAFPFVMLGLGLLGLNELGPYWTRWLAIDVLWSISAGLITGILLGKVTAKLIVWIRSKGEETTVLEDFLAIGLICLSYGGALLVHAYGFLAVFAAGLTLRNVERLHSEAHEDKLEEAVNSDAPPAQVAKAVLTFNQQLERLGEVLSVIVVGTFLNLSFFLKPEILLLPIIFLVIRPLAVHFGLLGVAIPRSKRRFIGWFGIRGIGSIYYLSYAVNEGVPDDIANEFINIVVATVAVSVLIHGISVAPLMDLYQKRTLRFTRRNELSQPSP